MAATAILHGIGMRPSSTLRFLDWKAPAVHVNVAILAYELTPAAVTRLGDRCGKAVQSQPDSAARGLTFTHSYERGLVLSLRFLIIRESAKPLRANIQVAAIAERASCMQTKRNLGDDVRLDAGADRRGCIARRRADNWAGLEGFRGSPCAIFNVYSIAQI